MELVNIWEDYIRISLGWKITTFGEKKASLQLSECFRYTILPDGVFLLVKTPEFQKLLVTNRLRAENPRSLRDTAVSQFQVKFA